MKVALLILLCLMGLLSLPICARAGNVRVLSNVHLCSGGIDWNQCVVRNVTGTGTLIMNDTGATIVCDNGESYTNNNDERVQVLNASTRRVFFTIGILDTEIVLIPETPPQSFVIYHMKDLPSYSDVWSVCRLFNSRLGQTNYNAGFDLDGNGIINMRDVVMSMRFAHLRALT